MSLQQNIKDLIFFYVKSNYEKYLNENNIQIIPESDVDNLINKLTKNSNKISGEEIFKLYDTYGFPTEIIQEIASEKNISLDMISFEKLMSKQKKLSKKILHFLAMHLVLWIKILYPRLRVIIKILFLQKY